MLGVAAVTAIVVALAAWVYLRLERLRAAAWGMLLLRAAGTGALALLLFDPSWSGRRAATAPTVLLDASLSMQAAGGRWQQALETARALAGANGRIVRFGAGVEPADSGPPQAGESRLGDALRLAHGRGGPVVVVTDGEIEDAAALEPGWLAGARVVIVAREPVPDAAILEVSLPEHLSPGDSLSLEVLIGTAGPLDARRARLVADLDGRVVARRDVELPPAPGSGRRRLVLPSSGWKPGFHLLTLKLETAGDAEPRDDVRQRGLEVAAQPQIVVLAAPAGWEARFLVRELAEIQPGSVRGFAMIGPGQWRDMQTLEAVSARELGRAVGAADVTVTLGTGLSSMGGARARWEWLGADSTQHSVEGDWYVDRSLPPSPLAGAIAAAAWDSVPPLVGLVPADPSRPGWVALSVRLARRGMGMPLVAGRDSSGRRVVTVAGEGLWRWALRGGASREAYRSLLAGTLDWLLAPSAARAARLVAPGAVPRGKPAVFQFRGAPVPDSVEIRLDDGRTLQRATLRFDAEGRARMRLEPGVYRWQAVPQGLGGGHVVVESYSDEFPPRPVTLAASSGQDGVSRVGIRARQRPWLFALVIAALAGEWLWRRRKGLP